MERISTSVVNFLTHRDQITTPLESSAARHR